MEFSEAEKAVFPMRSQYFPRTIGEVAETDEGLLHLDWLQGQPWFKETTSNWGGHFFRAVNRYLEEPAIAQELDRLVGGEQ